MQAYGAEGLFNVTLKIPGTSCVLLYLLFTHILISPCSHCHAVAVDSLNVQAFPSLLRELNSKLEGDKGGLLSDYLDQGADMLS